jgi:hypothetical protein
MTETTTKTKALTLADIHEGTVLEWCRRSSPCFDQGSRYAVGSEHVPGREGHSPLYVECENNKHKRRHFLHDDLASGFKIVPSYSGLADRS